MVVVNWIKDKIVPVFFGFFGLGSTLIVLTALITRSEIAIISVGVVMIVIGGLLSGLLAEKMTPVARQRHTGQ